MRVADQKEPVQIAISVPKRKFRRATERNLIRRRVRESYRTYKHKINDFLENRNLQLHILVVYSSTEILDFERLNQQIIKILNHLILTLSDD